MVYVQRDAAGRLLRVEHEPFEGMTENLAVESEELHSWLEAKEEVKARLDSLKQSDLELVRVLEDVVSVLVERGVIRYTDLPEAARSRTNRRHRASFRSSRALAIASSSEIASNKTAHASNPRKTRRMQRSRYCVPSLVRDSCSRARPHHTG